MKNYAHKTAVITGGGSGIGREIALQLASEGCNVALCDLSADGLAETGQLCEAGAPKGTRITTHIADVSDEAQVLAFCEGVRREQATDHIHLLFNNAGIGGGGSFIKVERDQWEKTFNVCWFGVYYCCRAFLPMILKAPEAHIVNTSSVNGFWASLGPGRPHTAYSAAKFAVKGFTEALVNDLRLFAPHVKCSVVMPGHVGTGIARNTRQILTGKSIDELDEAELARSRHAIAATGVDASKLSDDRVRAILTEQTRRFEEEAPTSATEAATVILDGVRQEKWRILIGPDADALDAMVRETPEDAYELSFAQRLREAGHWKFV